MLAECVCRRSDAALGIVACMWPVVYLLDRLVSGKASKPPPSCVRANVYGVSLPAEATFSVHVGASEVNASIYCLDDDSRRCKGCAAGEEVLWHFAAHRRRTVLWPHGLFCHQHESMDEARFLGPTRKPARGKPRSVALLEHHPGRSLPSFKFLAGHIS